MSLDASVPRSMSSLSLHSTGSQNEDWDRSESDIPTDAQEFLGNGRPTTTPRNSVIFPADDGAEKTPGRTEAASHGKGERTLSQLLKLHAADGTEGKFSQEEASRIAEVLGQWINSESSPYEAEDDFFTRSQDDSSLSVNVKRPSPDSIGRRRGQSESVMSSRPSAAEAINA